MKGYNRMTERRETPLTMSMWAGDSGSLKVYNRLAKLEDKIESGELVDRKKVVKECLQVLRDMRVVHIYDDYEWGWDSCIDRAIEQLTEKYNIDVEGEE